jgi:hypothetical protein
MDKTQQSRLNQLRKYIPTEMDAEIVKEMIADGLSNEQILHALGHVSGTPKVPLPNDHGFAHQKTLEQQEQESQAADLQPGQVAGDSQEGDSEDDSGDNGEEIVGHLAGILNHISRKKKQSK